MIRTHSIASVAALALTAGAVQAAVMQLDINGIAVTASEAFTGTDYTGELFITKSTTGTLLDILVDGHSVGGAPLDSVEVRIDIENGLVVGGQLYIEDGDENRYEALIGRAGRVNVQAGRGYRIDGLTFEGGFSAPGPVMYFGGVDLAAVFGNFEELDGSFLLASFSPDDQGFDSRADFDVFIVPTPGTVALAGLAGIAVVRRKR